MAQTDNAKLDTGDTFPELSLDLLNGGTLTLPDSSWTILLFYRGLF